MKQETIDKLTEKALSYLNSVEAFTAKEVPEYLKELLEFKFFEHSIEAFTKGIFIFVTTIMCYFFITRFKKIDERLGDGVIGLCIIQFVMVIASITLMFDIKDNILQAYKAKKAPRVYLIDYLRGEK